jgi:hypothetical protein
MSVPFSAHIVLRHQAWTHDSVATSASAGFVVAIYVWFLTTSVLLKKWNELE